MGGAVKSFTRSFVWLPTVALVAALGVPSLAQAQGQWSVQGRAGIAIPAGDLSDVQDLGPSFGAGAAYWFRDRLAVRADLDVDLLSGADNPLGGEFEDITLYHYNAGVEYDLMPPGQSQWKVHANAGIGATTSDSDAASETDFSLNGGAKVGYAVTPRVHVFGGARAYVIFADETIYSIPIHGGVRVLLPTR